MNSIKSIRARLNLTQAELAKALEMSQGNVAFYERGQTVPPHVARRLIQFARTCGHDLGYEDVYGPLDESTLGHKQKPTPAPTSQAPEASSYEAQGATHA